ncbi:UDP-glucose 4-epimerase GalE [Saliniradius amylolyticus]|nr:UDP-glucose 4-epimerase GalE [Saliniradius amylolyticus]
MNNITSPNVLVTGGLGYVGSHTCVALHQAGYTPIIYDNLSNSSAAVAEQLARICGRRFDLIQAEVGDAQALKQCFADYPIEAVLHFAALKAVGESTAQPLMYYQNNVCDSAILMKQMHEAGIKRLVFSSSATVYGDPQYLPIDEDHSKAPTNPYGWSKLMVEQMMRDQCQAHSDDLSIALRYFNPVGAHESGLLGENPTGIPNNLVPYVTQTAVGQREKLHIYGNDYDTPDGTGIRDYVHVMDLAEGHVQALGQLYSSNGFHAFNLGTGTGASVLDVVNTFEAVSGRAVPYSIAERRPGDVATTIAAPTLAKARLNWQASRDLKQMLADSWHWQSKYPQGI